MAGGVSIRVRGHEVQDANMLSNVLRTQRSTCDGSWEMALGSDTQDAIISFVLCVCVYVGARINVLTVNSVHIKTATDSMTDLIC